MHSFVYESKVATAYSSALQKTSKLASKVAIYKGLGLAAMYGSLDISWALLSWYGGLLVRNETTSGGNALIAILSVITGALGLGQVMLNMEAFATARGAAFKIFKSIDNNLKITNIAESAKTLKSIEGLIELHNVAFSYPSRPDVPIFKNCSLVIPPGKTAAIVGSSGSGKSTIISLIERFYEPLAGEILLDGHNVAKLNLKWLREQIGLVNQEPALFSTTIVANILYGKENATQIEIEEATRASNAHTFIDQLPLGYQTQVGERGLQLSGGQKQRIAISRAMLKNPKILLLDEATSALDAASEKIVQEALDQLMIGRTTIVVAHRLSTIQDADIIFVVEQGQIVETGTHEELMLREDGAYSTLVRLQEIPTMEGIYSKAPDISQILGQGESYDNPMTCDISTISSGLGKESKVATRDKKTELLVVRKGLMMRLIAMTKGDWIYSVGGLIGSIGAGCLNPIWAFLMGSVLALYFNEDKSYMKGEVTKFSFAFISLAVAAPFIYTLQHYCLGVLGEKLVKHVREQMFGTILKNEVGWFDQVENDSNQISARLSSDAMNVKAAFGDRFSVIVQNISLIFASFIISLILQWKMALVMGATLPLTIAAAMAQDLALMGFAGDLAKAYSLATRVAGEAVENIRTVAAFNAEEKVQEVFLCELKGPMKKTFYRGQIAGFGLGICECLNFASYALSLWYAGQLVAKGEAKLAEVLRVYFVLVFTAFAMAETISSTPNLVKGGQAVASVFEILDRKTKIDPDDPKGMEVNKVKGDIELENISFAYPSRPDVMIFNNLNLKISSGHSLALVGSSGSGKSSIIALIERFYDPLSGRVLIDGIDLRKMHLKSVRQHIALVMQEPALSATSIYENILYGKDGASEGEVIEAAKVANAHAFISSLPEGYKTQVGERGVLLSGGQKQRIAIARAVLKDPAILLLDEATSALDAESERMVQEALDQSMKGRTTVIVAHRLSTVQGADSVVVVQDGAIIKGDGYAHLIHMFRKPYLDNKDNP